MSCGAGKYPAPRLHQKKYLKERVRRNGHQYHHRVFYHRRYQNGVIRPEVNIKVLHIHHITN